MVQMMGIQILNIKTMKHLFTLILTLSMLAGYSQEVAMQVLATAGGYYENTGAGLSLSWTLGEPAYTTLTSSEVILTQGFQQGNLFGTNLEEIPTDVTAIRVYPNPVTSTVNIAVTLPNAKGRATVEVYDIAGRMVKSTSAVMVGHEPYRLDVSNLPSGIYLLRVATESPAAVRVVKLVKE